MSRLSISKAWDETTGVLSHDWQLIGSVALALIALPQAIADVIAPPATLSSAEPPSWTGGLMIIVAVVGLMGQIAIMRLALGRTSVGEAIGRGARRVLPAFAALFLLALAVTIVALPVMLAIAGQAGVQSLDTARPSPAAALAVLLVLLACLFGAPKFQLIMPLAAGEDGGPIHLLRRAWTLSNGVYWKLLAFLVLILLVAIIVVLFGGQVMVGLLIKAIFGTVEPLSFGALIAALLSATIGAAFGAVAAVMLARIYVQLAGRGVSVPSSGT